MGERQNQAFRLSLNRFLRVAFELWTWLCLALTLLTLPACADFAAGQRAYDQGDFAAAFREWRADAEKGDARAQYALGNLYRDGKGVTTDMLQAVYWWWQAAKQGHPEAQQYVGWPITSANRPYLTCAPRDGAQSAAGAGPPFKIDSTQYFDFEITMHNDRPIVEQMVLAGVENYMAGYEPKQPNLEVTVYRLEGGQRTEVPRRLFHHGGSSGPYGDEARLTHFRTPGISQSMADVSIRIPVEETERQKYAEAFLAELEKSGARPEQLRQARQLLTTRPSGPSYFDNLWPNRPGVYDVVCRYKSQDLRFWPGSLAAPPLRFEFVRKQRARRAPSRFAQN